LGCLPTPDLAHHYFWRHDDQAALEHIYSHYEEVDRAIGRLIDTVGDDTTVVVFSDHGGRPAPRRIFGVNRWLADEGYLTPRRSTPVGSRGVALTNRVVNWAKKHRLNHAVASRIRGGLRRRVSAMTHNTAFVDWTRTRAFGLDFICPIAGVEINLRGRQSHGIVSPADYESLCEEIIERLTSLRDPETGATVMSRVCRREEMFDGPHVERFPDVVGVLADDYDVKGHLDIPLIGPNTGQSDYPYLGYHGYDGYFCARGLTVPVSAPDDIALMVDIAPTLLALAGVEPPDFMEGRPLRVVRDPAQQA
jgi:predicted AlkP superfamily phosphohydrolase/phosphomutase